MNPRAWTALVVVASLLVVGSYVAGETDLGTGLLLFFLLALLPLRFPLEGAYLVLMTGWLPVETVLGKDRAIFTSVGGLNASGMRLIGGIVGLSIALWLMRDKLRALRLPPWFLIGLAGYGAFVAWAVLSLLWAPDLVEGARGVAKMSFPVLVAAVIAVDPRDLGPRRLVVRTTVVLIASLLAATAYGFLGLLSREHILATQETGWVADSFGWAGWSSFGFFAGIVGVLLLALAGARAWRDFSPGHDLRNRLFLYGMVALAFIQIPLALKRISVGAAGLGVTAAILIAGPRRWLAPIGLVTAVAVLFLFPPLVERNVYEKNATPDQPNITQSENSGGKSVGAIGDIAKDPSNVSNVIRFEGRDALWREAFDEMQGKEWVIGHGINAWIGGHLGISGSGQLHGEPVRVIFELGGLGVLFATVGFGALFLAFVRLGVKSPRGSLSRAAGGAAAGTLALYVATTLTDNTLDYYLIGAYAWAVFAIAAVAWRADGDSGPDDDSGSPAPVSRAAEREPVPA